jgi:hypothetical protein
LTFDFGRCAANQSQVAERGAKTLATDVDFRVIAVDVDDRAFEAKRPDGHP